jgi:acyl transferase domain-containing protein
MAAVIKSVLCLEKSVITPNLNFATANPRLMLGSSNILVPTCSIPWPECEVRRCSINNFGYGGTNAHAIIDDAYNYLRLREKLPNTKKEFTSVQQPRVFVLSAPEQAATARQRHAHADYVESRCTPATVQCLARTLSERRSIFQWRHVVVASSAEELPSLWRDDTIRPVKAARNPNVAFVFTGQGAQWYGMGRELVCFPKFAGSIHRSAACLADLGCAWDAWAELMYPESEAESKVKKAEYSQTLCLILQIALVDLTAHWGIKPMAVIGHSSGEIAAAYAAGALSREDCLKVAYHRGLVSEIAQVRKPGGCMMAVGLSVEDIQPYIAHTDGAVVVACINSPENVTLAGDRAALEKLEETLVQDKKFCRLLQVENAYHSSQMLSVSADYRKSINDILAPQAVSSVAFYSTLHGRQIPTSELTADYWVQNLCSAVRFVDALDDMMYASVANRQLKAKSKAPSLLFEIGPHSALAGPIKQYKANRDTLQNLTYNSILARGQDASLTAVGAAGALWAMGVPIKLDKVSRPENPQILDIGCLSNMVTKVNNVDGSAGVLTDLPTYQWNHSTSYWHESRQSRNHRLPQFARHDLIGSRLDSYNPIEPVWKNHLRVSDLPWLQDHQIHGDIVFPAAGMICSAVEATRQIAAAEGSSQNVSGFVLRELSVSKALVIPNNDIGVEVYINLKRRKLGLGSGAGTWFEFSYYSCQHGDTFVEHAAGLLEIQYSKKATEVDGGKEAREEILAYNERWNSKRALCLNRVTRSSHYDFCDEQGLHFGK